jgi:1,2-diacylglycerol 3-beta-galactosyltransferase
MIREPVPLLFLVSDTGGGHRAAARAVGEALAEAATTTLATARFAPILCDPLAGPGSAPLPRWVTRLYGPATRLAPWAWGAAYHLSNSRAAAGLLLRTLFRPASRLVADAIAAYQPAVIVSFHPLTGHAAVAARRRTRTATPVLTVVTDLASGHASWRYADTDAIAVPFGEPPPAAPPAGPGQPASPRWPAGPPVSLGLPVGRAFRGPLPEPERAALRRSLGLPASGFLIVLAGGGEGCGGLARRARALSRHLTGVHLAVICGRNRRLRRRLTRRLGRPPRWRPAAGHGRLLPNRGRLLPGRGRRPEDGGNTLTVTGFVPNMADWLRCADLVVSKAGPGAIAEAACCGTPLLLTSHLPGQERGNTALVVSRGAGLHVPRTRQLVREAGRLQHDPAALAALRAGAARLARPGAAAEVARLIAGLSDRKVEAWN